MGGCGVFAPRREISTSSRDTVSPGARESAEEARQGEGKEGRRGEERKASVRARLCGAGAMNGGEAASVPPSPPAQRDRPTRHQRAGRLGR